MSRVSVEKGCYAFLWKIENFEYFVRKNDLSLFSPYFNTQWKLELLFSTSVEKHDFFWLRLRNKEPKLHDGGTVDCEVSLLANDDTVIRNLNIFGAVVPEWTNMSCADCIPMSEIVDSHGHQFPPKYTIKVLCRIWKQGMQSGQDFARTVFSKETFIWNNHENITQSFPLASRHFTITLTKSGSYATDGIVDVKTVQTDGEELKFARLQLAKVYADGKEPDLLQDYSFIPSILKHSWCFPITLKQEHLPNDSLSLKCDFTIATDEVWTDPLPKLLDPPKSAPLGTRNPQNAVPRERLVKDLWRMYSDKTFCDVTLKSSTGKEFPAHKSILSARSTVFDSMFEDKTVETVDMPDLDSGTLSRMLMFIYIDYSHNLHWKEAGGLYVAAHKYDLKHLEQECISVFERGMTIPRACEALGMTEIHLNEALKQCVWEYIWEHYEDVIKSDEWKSLEENKPKLVIQVLRDMGLKKFKKSD